MNKNRSLDLLSWVYPHYLVGFTLIQSSRRVRVITSEVAGGGKEWPFFRQWASSCFYFIPTTGRLNHIRQPCCVFFFSLLVQNSHQWQRVGILKSYLPSSNFFQKGIV